MKGILLSTCLFLLVVLSAHATIHQVSVANFQFSPKNLPNVLVGDTIDWVWQNGDHTTTSLTIPAGAMEWNEQINSSSTTYRYIVAIAGTYNYECVPHAPDMAGSFVATAPLPVILAEFKATSTGQHPTLSWTTSSEEQTDHFSVRRSLDGSDYTEIGRVAAAGNSHSEQNYSFVDKAVPAANKYLYYVVVIVDKDGKTQHSPIRMVVNGKARSLLVTSLSPNPVNSPGHLMLTFNADAAGQMDAVLSNLAGKSILRVALTAVKGVNNGHIHLGDVPPGTYNITFFLNGLRETRRVIIQ